MPWAAAVALGAIVAPPDAAAAGAVLKQVRLPHRLVVILEGESLLNDASALLIYRFAVGAAAGGITVWALPVLALASLGGFVLGYAMARLFLRPHGAGRARARPTSCCSSWARSGFGCWRTGSDFQRS